MVFKRPRVVLEDVDDLDTQLAYRLRNVVKRYVDNKFGIKVPVNQGEGEILAENGLDRS